MAIALDQGRVRSLVARLLSPAVQVPEPAPAESVEARLSPKQVEKVFRDHVPGVERFLFRGHHGQHSLSFLVSAYAEGFRAFKGTHLDQHLTWCMRHVVHCGQEGGQEAIRQLREVAESFQDCQAVQARAVERASLRLRGLVPNFEGLVTRLVGEYKTMAIKMLAAERIAKGLANDPDGNPAHYENRLTADLGDLLGLNRDDIRRAGLDQHAQSRFPQLRADEARDAAGRARELFDVPALLAAFVAEVNSFDEASDQQSMSRLFLRWADEHMQASEKHIVFDEATCSRVSVDVPLALCIFERVFLGGTRAREEEVFRSVPLRRLFVDRPGCRGALDVPRGDAAMEESGEEDMRNPEEPASPSTTASPSPPQLPPPPGRRRSPARTWTEPSFRRRITGFWKFGFFARAGRGLWRVVAAATSCRGSVLKRLRRQACSSIREPLAR